MAIFDGAREEFAWHLPEKRCKAALKKRRSVSRIAYSVASLAHTYSNVHVCMPYESSALSQAQGVGLPSVALFEKLCKLSRRLSWG